ncbi:hypothetical protein [Flavobacterium sp.]|jgi:hypothetical protein|uniref:hypothetical protein n=1 Tax=Flavobacterium sp. TaxID=239 RepID=UPI0037C0E1F1
MPDLVPSQSIDINQQLSDLSIYKYHMSGISQITLNRLIDMLAGKVEITEPSNPFAYLVETSSLNTAFAIQEFAIESRKRYARLANTEDDLYLHMSDYDFLGRFSEPSYANVLFNIMFNDFKTKAVYDPSTRDYVLKLPRHLKLKVADYVFTLTTAIIIRLTETNVVDVKFENQDFVNIFPITTNYINFVQRQLNQTDTYLSFMLSLPEIDIETANVAIDPSSVAKDYIVYNSKRQFYFFRAFSYQNDVWTEMLVTHTNDVYDVNTPTCIIKVLPDNNKVEYHIPSVYINTGKVSTKVKFLVYTTLGKVAVNFSDFQMSDFSTEYGDVFPETELDNFTKPIQSITKVIYTTDSIDGGKNGMSFEQLKQSVIDNSIGDRKLPITSKQLTFTSNQNNFKIIKDVDIVTGRMYKLETEVPAPLTRYPVTKFNLDILEHRSTIEKLRDGNSTTWFGEDITVLPEGTVFRLNDGVLSHISVQEHTLLKAASGANLVSMVNQNTYLSLYYHYVINTSENQTSLRAYDLTSPEVSLISFKQFNPTARVSINTTSINLYKSPVGYTLDVLANLKKYTETITQNNIHPYLVYKDVSGAKFYLEGTLLTTLSNNPVYRFNIETKYHIDKSNQIYLSNFRDSSGNETDLLLNLNCQLEIIYLSDVIPFAFAPSEMDTYVHTSFLAGQYAAVTLEDVKLTFGHYLETLFSGMRTSTTVYEYQTYTEDQLLLHTQTVYNPDNTIRYMPGDPVLDDQGNPVVQFHKGDVVLVEGEPVPINTLGKERYLNLMFVDYRVTLATASTSKDHNKQIKKHISEMCLSNALTIKDQLLDNTEAFVVIPKTVDQIRVKTPTRLASILSMQTFSVDVFVVDDIYKSASIRDNISYTITRTLDDYLYSNTTIKKSEFLKLLIDKLKEFVVTISVPLFTELNDEYIQIIDTNSRISVNKTLVMEADGYNLTEDIVIRFTLVE